jgi:hypothetical protein
LRDQPGAVVERDRGPLRRSQPGAGHVTAPGPMYGQGPRGEADKLQTRRLEHRLPAGTLAAMWCY